MLFRQYFLEGIAAGRIRLAFRRWRRPSVKSGGTLLTAAGQLEIRSVLPVETRSISERDAHEAGYPDRATLLEELNQRDEGDVYRIELGALTADPRVALRDAALTSEDLTALRQKLERLDARATGGAWTRRALEVIRDHPERRAGDLCRKVGMEKEDFKINIRKLKQLGLTESLEVGYRLSPRGRTFLNALQVEQPREG